MADTKKVTIFRYKIEVTYIDTIRNKNTRLLNESLKSLIIDSNYENNCMPVLYATLTLDKLIIDDMILNANNNLLLISIYKINTINNFHHEILCLRDRFIYFLPEDINKLINIEYNETNIDEHFDNSFRTINIGLLSLNMINKNKKYIEFTAHNNSIYDCVKYITKDIDNLIIEPFNNDKIYDQIIIPPKDTIKSALEFLNSYRVFYYSPYRYFQDFNFTYIISSSGNAISRNDESMSYVLVNIHDVDLLKANDEGLYENKSTGTYEVDVNFADASVYDNTIVNKSRNTIKGITSTGSDEKTLKNTNSYLNNKIKSFRLDNDNENMLYNIEAEANNNKVYIFFVKNDLDMDVFTINKKITVNNIERYKDYNGTYLLSRKRESFSRENEYFILSTMINLKKCSYSSTVHIESFKM